MDPKQSRGYRNKNPGNIDHVAANKWQGLDTPPIEAPPSDGSRARFCRFVSHEYGIRALAVLLTTYQDRYGLRTIAAIIGKWAPGNENNTAAYISAVARDTGFTPGEVLDLHTYEDLRPLVAAIIKHELGGQPYTAAVLDQGLLLAGVPRPVSTIAEAATSPTGKTALQAAGATGAVGAVVAAAPALSGLQGLDWRVGLAVVVAGFIGAVIWILQRKKASRNESAS